ncbi:hypothetical protein [Nonomuraea zeae]|uniref:Uncharacterized protein n=1 Tax=Nonomuraea zeae TaxID=1642303 RepID=A0A5S4FY44_9ACTN|nr:hypothetical protein [Nonomuraea zeae]TMR25737.1 hypothetical protein ETD85_44935 [Nonomuraea zeae]
MSDTSDELPEAVVGAEGESDVVAERSGAGTPRSRRPVPADPPEARDEPEHEREREDGPELEREDGPDEGDEVIRPDAGPTG